MCAYVCVCGPGHSVQAKSILYSSPHLNDTLGEKQINSPGRAAFHRFCFVHHRVGWSDAPLQGATRPLNQRAALWEWSSWLLKTPACVCRGAQQQRPGAFPALPSHLLTFISATIGKRLLYCQQIKRVCLYTSWCYGLVPPHYPNDEMMRINQQMYK